MAILHFLDCRLARLCFSEGAPFVARRCRWWKSIEHDLVSQLACRSAEKAAAHFRGRCKSRWEIKGLSRTKSRRKIIRSVPETAFERLAKRASLLSEAV
jgi:hypothetical protein